MEHNIIISNLNDFIFCPRSIYFHNVYSSFDESMYHSTYQVEGKNSHATIDENKYSTKKTLIQGMPVFSGALGVFGKIDLFDEENGLLVERKRTIKKLYDGYFLQIYAQFFCLVEMGYCVKTIQFHSLSDNKRFDVPLPTEKDKQKLLAVIQAMKSFDIHDPFSQNPNKCKMCIYRSLCDYYHDDE